MRLILLISFFFVLIDALIAVQLSKEEFDDVVGKDSFVFVDFFAPWCGHCQRLAPTWDQLENKILSYPESKLVIAKVDCTRERELCSREQVIGYPTIKLYKAGHKNGLVFEGATDLVSLETFLRTQLGDEIVEGQQTDELADGTSEEDNIQVPKPVSGLYELADENFQEFLAKGHHFVKFYAPWCSHCQRLAPTWEQLAESFQHSSLVKISKVDCTINWLACKQFDVKSYPTLLWIVDGKMLERYQGHRTHEELKLYVSNLLNEEITEEENLDTSYEGSIILSEKTFKKTISDGITFIKFKVPWCTHCKKLKSVWDQLSSKFFGHESIQIATVDCAQQENLCNSQQIDGYPTMIIYKNGEKLLEYEGPRQLEDLFDFVQKQSHFKDEL